MKHSRTAAGAATAAPAAGLLLGGAPTATAGQRATAQRITTEQEPTQSVLAAVALERGGSTEPLAPTGVGRAAVLPCRGADPASGTAVEDDTPARDRRRRPGARAGSPTRPSRWSRACARERTAG